MVLNAVHNSKMRFYILALSCNKQDIMPSFSVAAS